MRCDPRALLAVRGLIMANYVEQATLRLIDETSANAAKINKSLKALFATAAKSNAALSGAGNFKAGSSGAAIRKMTADIVRLKAASANIPQMTVKVSSSQVLTAIGRVKTLKSLAASPITASVISKAPQTRGNRTSVPQVAPTAPGAAAGGRSAGGFVTDVGRGIAHEIGREVAQAVSAALRGVLHESGKGILEADDVQLKMRMNSVPEDERKRRTALANQIAADPKMSIGNSGSQILNSSMDLQNLSHSAEDVNTAMLRGARNMTILSATMKGGSEEIESSARQLNRITEIKGFGTDPAKAQVFNDEILKAITVASGDLSATDALATLQGLRSGNVNVSAAGFGDVLAARQGGGKAAVDQIRQFEIGSLDKINKSDMAKQQAAGLRDDTGKSLYRKEITDNPIRFITDKLTEVLKTKRGFTEDDLNDPAKVASGLQDIGYNATRAGAAATAIQNRDQIKKERERRTEVDLQAPFNAPSLRMDMRNVTAQIEQLAGVATKSLVPVIKGGLEGISTLAGKMSAGDASPTEIAKAAAASALGVAALGVQSGIQGLTSKDPATRALSAAGISLTSAGVALDGAAAAIVAAEGAGAAGKLLGIGGGLLPAIAASLGVPALAAGLGLLIAEAIDQAFNDGNITKAITSDMAKIFSGKDVTPENAAMAKSAVSQFDDGNGIGLAPEKTEIDFMRSAAQSVGKSFYDLSTESGRLNAALADAMAKQQKDRENATGLPGDTIKEAGNARRIAFLEKEIADLKPQVSTFGEGRKDLSKDPMFRETMKVQPNDGTTVASLGMDPATVGQFTASSDKLATTLDGYQNVFTTGAAKLVEAGPGFGAAAGSGVLAFAGQFGSIAGAAIAAAAGNISINVKSTSGGPNLGSNKPQE